MNSLQVVIFVLATVVGAFCLRPRGLSTQEFVEYAKNAPRDQLAAELRALLSPQYRSAIDDSLINFINTTVRQIILTGSEDLGIPVLDPLQVDHLDLNLDLDQVQLVGEIDNAQVLEISTFVIDNIKVNLLGLSGTFGFHVPEIVAKGEHYDINGTVGGLIPVWGDGAFSASVEGLFLGGKLSLGTNNSYIYVKGLDLDVNITAVKTAFEGLLGGGDLGDVANEVISEMAPEVFENAKPTLMPVLSDAVINLANEKLVGVTLQDILDWINGNNKS